MFFFTETLAQCMVKLEVTRMHVLTSATNQGRWNCTPLLSSGGQSGGFATTRTKK